VTRRDPPHNPEAVYTIALVIDARCKHVQGSQVTISRARELVRLYDTEAELLEPDGHVRWIVGRGGALRAKRRPGAGGKVKSASGPALARVHVRVTREHHAAIVAACQRAGCTITHAVEALPDLLALMAEATSKPA
jgi:hypothetical protein